MKHLTRLLEVVVALLLCLPLSIYGQCTDATPAYLNGNAVRAPFYPSGHFFHLDQDAGFIPNYRGDGLNVASIFAGGLWAAGFTEDGNLKLAASEYGWASEHTDYVPGPIDPSTGLVWEADLSCTLFNQVWKVQGYQVRAFVADYNDNESIDNPIPEQIKAWPGAGNPFFEEMFGVALPAFNLAPFFDRNANGIYEPSKGDYPALGLDYNHTIPEELIWTVFNDQTLHTESRGDPLNIEVQLTAWAFECADLEVLNESIFTSYKITNYNLEPLEDVRIGVWLDPDVGCYTDDYTGCDPALNTAYFYNSDAEDGDPGSSCLGGVNTFSEEPPVQAFTVLNHSLSSFSFMLNSAIGNPVIATTEPSNALEYYNYLDGKWKDGSDMTVGGLGYNPNSTEVTKFLFFDNPTNPEGWSQVQAGAPPYLDFRALSTVNFERMESGEVVRVDGVYSLHPKNSDWHLEAVNTMEESIPLLQEFYDNRFVTGCSRVAACVGDNCVWPGDANNDGIANHKDVLAIGIGAGQQQVGDSRTSINTSWRPNTAADWETTLADGTNYKHTDCNGDGRIAINDQAILKNNYNRANSNLNYTLEPPTANGDITLSFASSKSEISFSTSSRLVPIQIHLDTKDSEVYGLAFSVDFPTEIINQRLFSIAQFTDQTFLTSEGLNLELTHIDLAAGKADFAFCRIDLTNVSGTGRIANLLFTLGQDFATPNEDGTLALPFTISDVRAINADEEVLQVEAEAFSIFATDVPYDSTLVATKELAYEDHALQISPNPSTGAIQVVGDMKVERLQILDVQGQLKATRTGISKQSTIQLPELPAGLYFLRFIDSEGRQLTKRLILTEKRI